MTETKTSYYVSQRKWSWFNCTQNKNLKNCEFADFVKMSLFHVIRNLSFSHRTNFDRKNKNFIAPLFYDQNDENQAFWPWPSNWLTVHLAGGVSSIPVILTCVQGFVSNQGFQECSKIFLQEGRREEEIMCANVFVHGLERVNVSWHTV